MIHSEVGVSVAIPLFNEEESAPVLHEQLKEALESLGETYEIIFVDDGSSDSTYETISEIAKKDSTVRAVKFRRNYGQTPAMAAGIDLSAGRIIVTMDGDLQNDPKDIPNFIEKIAEGYDIVVGWRHNRQDKLITRKIPSRMANWLIGKVTGVPIRDNGCSLKAYRASLIKSVPLYSEMHRFIPAMASITGAKVAEIKVTHHARRFGVSKYGLSRIYKVLLDLLVIKTLVAFSSRPLTWFAILAAPALVAGISAIWFSLYQVIVLGNPFSAVIAGTGLMFSALGGFMIFAGVFAELVYKTGDMRIESLFSLTATTVGEYSSPGARR